jgi:hypothetical protein
MDVEEVTMWKPLFAMAIIVLFLSGCMTSPPVRSEYVGLPALDSGWSRIYVTAGKLGGGRLWSVNQVGPVFINNENVGSTAKDEYIAVDLLPGTYDAYCTPEQPDKNFIEKTQLSFKAGDLRYFVCDMDLKGAGNYFGAIGVLASDYLTKTYLVERPFDNQESKLVAYKKIKR